MRRIRRPMMGFNEFADGCKDPQNRDLTWRVSFQTGWHEPENRILNKHNQHKRDWPRTPCTVSHFIHAQTGRIVDGHDYPYERYNKDPGESCRGANLEFLYLLATTDRRARSALHQMHQRLFSYLPESPAATIPD